jgi:hypothetical protein
VLLARCALAVQLLLRLQLIARSLTPAAAGLSINRQCLVLILRHTLAVLILVGEIVASGDLAALARLAVEGTSLGPSSRSAAGRDEC